MQKEIKNIEKYLKDNSVELIRTSKNEVMLVAGDESVPLSQAHKLIRKIFLEKEKVFLNAGQTQTIIEYLEIHPITNPTIYETACRICYMDDKIIYELNKDTKECIVVSGERVCTGKVDNVIFKHASDYQNQVMPSGLYDPEELFELVHKHFNLKNERQEKLFILYLVTSFLGMGICHPLLILTGEKSSAKSTTMRKLEKIIDPKVSDLCGMPKGADGLELRLSNSYFVALDNLSSISRNVSDTIARAVTGGSVTKRALYHNTKEIVLDIKALVAINGVSLVARESDLLDRSLIIELERIAPDKIKSEHDLWKSFEKDRPRILGCILETLSEFLQSEKDGKTFHIKRKIRLADFHIACVKVGNILGMSEKEVSDLLWENQKNVNRYSLDEDIVACCVIELMDKADEYVNSMTGLLRDLNEIANNNSIVSTVLPKTPNHLTIRLNKVKSNLQAEYGITYVIANVGAFKQITIKKSENSCESCEESVMANHIKRMRERKNMNVKNEDSCEESVMANHIKRMRERNKSLNKAKEMKK
jgi:hypothetical protein